MKRTSIFFLALSLALLAQSGTASIYNSTPSAVIPWSAKTPSGDDQSQIYNSTYYLADQTNVGVRVVNLNSKTQTTIVTGGFVGVGMLNGTVDHDTSGPDGLIVLPDRNEMYVGNGDGTIKVIDLKTNTLAYTYPNVSMSRSDEGAYDQANGILVITSPAEDTPYLNIVSTYNRTVLGKVLFPNATGLDQPSFNPADSLFYVSVTTIPGSAPGGAIAAVNAKSMNIVKMFPLHQCMPSGNAFGPTNQLFIACSGQASLFGYESSYVLDVSTGTIVANVTGVGGIDQVAYSAMGKAWIAAANSNSVKGVATPQLQIVSSVNNTLVQTIATDTVLAHSVAVDSSNGDIAVPIQAKGVVVYSLLSSIGSSVSPPSSSSSPSSVPTFVSGGEKLYVSSAAIIGLVVFLVGAIAAR